MLKLVVLNLGSIRAFIHLYGLTWEFSSKKCVHLLLKDPCVRKGEADHFGYFPGSLKHNQSIRTVKKPLKPVKI